MATISIQGTDYDSYVSMDEANAYLNARLGATEWGEASFTNKNQSLVTATRWIVRVLSRLTNESLIPDPADDPTPTAAPALIKDATSELSYALIVDSDIQDKAAATSDNNRVLQAGSAKLERFRPVEGSALPTIVQQLVNEWISDVGGTTITAGAAYGTDGESAFEEADEDQFGLDVGYP